MPRSARENGSVHKRVRQVLGVGLLAAIAYAIWRKLPTRPETTPQWEPQPFPFPPLPVIDESPWVEPAASGACPAHHPIKAKLTSGIFHVPGGANYARTQPDRCYLSAEAAAADGLRQSKN
jgi:hypothetical protein